MSEINKIVSDERRNKLFASREKHSGFRKGLIYDDDKRRHNYEVEEAVERFKDSYK